MSLLQITERVSTPAVAQASAPVLRLDFDARQKSRLRTRLVGGEEVALRLARGAPLRGGDWLRAEDGRLIRVEAAPEAVVHVTCGGAAALARAAYHLGNRHVAVQVGEGFLRIVADHVLEDMLRGLGAAMVRMTAAFEPESGAYAASHAHAAPHTHAHTHTHAPEHGHDHGHAHSAHQHGPHCDHDHDHDHQHDHGNAKAHDAASVHDGKARIHSYGSPHD
jgi:urease accessory protein